MGGEIRNGQGSGRLRRGAGERRKANSMGRVHNRKGFVRVCVDITLRAAWQAGGANSVRVEFAAMAGMDRRVGAVKEIVLAKRLIVADR